MKKIILNKTIVYAALAICTVLSSNVYGQWIQKGLDIDGGTADDRFGHGTSLSYDGNTVASGAPCSGSVASNSGHVRVLEWSNVMNTWTQKGGNINGDNNGDKFGYSVSLSGDGNTVAIGAPKNNAIELSSGVVSIYEWNSGSNSWIQKGVDINGESADDEFGWSVCLSEDGNTFIGGARYNSVQGWGTGHARVYEWNSVSNSWDQRGADLDGAAAGSSAGFATSISADGNIVAVGSPYHNGVGQVKAYSWNAGANTWDPFGATLDGDPGDEEYGYSIDLNESGQILAIGSKGDCQTGHNSGHTRIYEWSESTSTWDQKGSVINGEGAWDLSGYWVSLNGSGNAVVVGAAFNDGNGSDSGHLRIFDWNSGTNLWIQRGIDIDGEEMGDQFGWSACLSSDGYTVAGGANANDDNGLSAGHVRVYEFPSPVGISAIKNELMVTIFPNPTNETITIDLNTEGEVSIGLFDVIGINVLKERFWSNGAIELNIEKLENGTYTVVIDTPKGRYVSALVKN